jgi:glutaconate CoA-transferase subunit A
MELDEGMMLLGLQAAAWRVPFLPTRAGLGTDLLRVMPEILTVRSPYPGGNAQFLGPDLYMDDLMAMAATKTFLSTEQVVPTDELAATGSFHTRRISRLMVTGVVEAPNGAHFTECPPDYGRDEAFQKEYAATASSAELWDEFRARYLDGTEDDYQRAVGARP